MLTYLLNVSVLDPIANTLTSLILGGRLESWKAERELQRQELLASCLFKISPEPA
jgi:Ran GTPase-activating protein (RanGAP) involved in mRNA processing and transport